MSSGATAVKASLPVAVPVALAVVGAVFSRFAVPFAFRYSMSFLPLLVVVLLYLLYRRRGKAVLCAACQSMRLLITGIITALLFASFLVMGAWGVSDDAGSFGALHILAILVNAVPLFVLFVLLMGWLDRFSQRANATPVPDAQPYRLRRSIGVFGILLLCWLPVYLAAFPGFFCYDLGSGDYPAWVQVQLDYLNAHQPVFHTLLVGAALTVSEALTDSIAAGVAVYVALQAVALSALFAFLVRVVRLSTRSRLVEVASIVYLAVDPLVSMFALCMAKDVLFSALVVMLAVLLFARFTQPAKERRPSGLVAIGACMLLVCLLRTNGAYAIVVLVPFLIAFEAGRTARVASASMCAAVLVLGALWFGPVASALHVDASPLQRITALSLPAQQLTYVVENEELTITERNDLVRSGFGVPDGSAVELFPYEPENADSSRMNLMRVSLPDAARLWFTFGAAHPQDFFKVFVEQTQTAWNPYAYGFVYRGGAYEGRETSLFAFDWEEPLESQSLAPWLLEPLRAFATTLDVQNVPLLSLLTSLPLYLWVLLLAAARAVVTLDKRVLLPCILFCALVLMALVGPCQVVRYYLYLIFGLPLLAAMLLTARPRSSRQPSLQEERPARS